MTVVPSGWTSWALGRLDTDPAVLTEQVLARAGLPDTPEGRELVELHLATLDVSLDLGCADLLVPQLRWELTRWPQVTAAPCVVPVHEAVRAALAERLDELTLAAVVRHVGAADTAARALESRSWSLRGRGGLSGLTSPVQTYLGHAVAGRQQRAIEHVLTLVADGSSVADVLLEVLAPAQLELGRLWERGVVSVAQEHVATAVTQVTMSALQPLFLEQPRLDRTLVAATPPGDRHEIGLRVVTDLLQLRGWDTQYVGAACPVTDLAETVVTTGATLLLLGASMAAHLPGLRAAVEHVRADPRCEGVTVLVGGEPFRHAAGLGEWVGADLVATDALEALDAAAGLVDVQEATGV